MIRIGIYDDNERELTHIIELLSQYKLERLLDCSYKSYRSAVDLLDGLRGGDYDLLLLDVLGLSGIQAAKEIREIDQKVKILFLSSSPEFAVESYSVDAFSYLLKPVKPAELFTQIDRAIENLTQQDTSGLTIKSRTGFTHIPFSKLEHVAVWNKTVGFHLSDGSIVETFGTLAAYEIELLARPEFLKVHRSYLVNLAYIKTLERGIILTRLNHEIPVGRTLSSQVKEAYMHFSIPSLPTVQTSNGAYQILLVDDDDSELTHWSRIIRRHGCEVSCASTGQEAHDFLLQKQFDCVILDVILSGEDGFALCKSLQEITNNPIIFLSCITDTESQLKGFACGGVDYITKDTPAELFWSKIEARIHFSNAKRTQLSFGPLLLDQSERKVLLEGCELLFTPTEFDLLWTMAEHSDIVYTPEDLSNAIWGENRWDDGQTLQSHMSRLRRKLEKAYPSHFFIETVWGKGYQFSPL